MRRVLASLGRGLRWLAFPVLLLAVAAVAVGLSADAQAAGTPASRARPASDGHVVTPLLSARRAPELVGAPLARRNLETALQGYLAQLPAEACLVVELQGERIAGHAPDQPLIPASNQKLLTGLAALDVLGADTQLVTRVQAAAEPVDGVVDGDLWLVGAGDPLLGTADYAASLRRQPKQRTPLEDLADAVVAAGITEVRGDVVGDESRYDAARTVPSWEANYVEERQVGPLTALSVNDGFDPYRPEPQPAADPPASAASALAALLRERGVTVAGGTGAGPVPDDAVEIAAVASPPVRDLVAQMLTDSDNGTGELLLKEIGLQGAGEGSTAAGAAVVEDVLARRGIPVEGVVAVDGSGLDRNNRLTCDVLTSVLGSTGPASDLGRGLAVAGRTGTLSGRYVGTAAEDRLSAKTGSLRDVDSLAGYVESPTGEVMTFGLIVNGEEAQRRGGELMDRLVDVLAAYPQAPPLETLGPEPAAA